VRRQAYTDVADTGKILVDVLKQRGSENPVEMSNAFMCAAIDSIGSFGFRHKFGCVDSVKEADRNYLVDVRSHPPARGNVLVKALHVASTKGPSPKESSTQMGLARTFAPSNSGH
jgi:hypothetical protein